MSGYCDLENEKVGDSNPSSPSTLSQGNYRERGDDVEAGRGVLKRNRLGSLLSKFFSKEAPEDREATKKKHDEIAETEILKLEDCPRGYSSTAAFLSSEPNFSLYRGFSYLYSRVILNLQDEIAVLERDLKDCEKIQREKRLVRRLQSREIEDRDSRNESEKRKKSAILSDLESKLVSYGKVLKQARDIGSFQKPSKRDYRSVRIWFCNTNPLVEKEGAFIKHKEDIISLYNGREWSAFDEIVEKFLMSLRSSFLRKIFSTPELQRKTTDADVHYYSRSRVELFVSLIMTSLIFALLVVPVVVMYKMTSVSKSQHAVLTAIGVLIVFTLLFSAAMGLLTVAKRHEIFAASAAYCAVLVVFIGNLST